MILKKKFDSLAKSARDAIKEVHQLSQKIGHNDWMDSIVLNQTVLFILLFFRLSYLFSTSGNKRILI
jgi:hypothetical protein